MPPTGPAALNGLRNHSRASSATSPYRPQPPPPQGPHSAKPSMSGQPPYGYPAQSPRIPNNGRNSPFPDYHDVVPFCNDLIFSRVNPRRSREMGPLLWLVMDHSLHNRKGKFHHHHVQIIEDPSQDHIHTNTQINLHSPLVEDTIKESPVEEVIIVTHLDLHHLFNLSCNSSNVLNLHVHHINKIFLWVLNPCPPLHNLCILCNMCKG